jgi:multicomponent K+:H+ antiporter subunit C
MSLEFLVATGIGWVTTCGIYLLLRGRTFPVVLGLTLLGYAVNVFIFAMGRLWSAAPPILTDGSNVADPLPQALVLTAIVIGFATTGFVIELALRSRHESGSDHVDGRRSNEGPGEPDRGERAESPDGSRGTNGSTP